MRGWHCGVGETLKSIEVRRGDEFVGWGEIVRGSCMAHIDKIGW